MRYSRSLPLGFLFLFVSAPLISQQTATTDTQATLLLQRAFAVLSGGTSITDVTLTGTARRIAGSDDETGTANVKALAGTGTRIELNLPSGTRSEVRNISAVPVVGSWSGPDGVWHSISNHNLFTDPGWFPAFTLSGLLSAANAVFSYVGPETHDGQSVIHLTASQRFTQLSADTAPLMQHLAQIDIFLDATTSLPTAIAFNTHPDNNALLDIPIEIRFSDYRPIGGARISFHVQKFINNCLALDLQFESAALNSGLSPSAFAVAVGL